MVRQDVHSTVNVNGILSSLDELQRRHMNLWGDIKGYSRRCQMSQILDSTKPSGELKPMIVEEVDQKNWRQQTLSSESVKPDISILDGSELEMDGNKEAGKPKERGSKVGKFIYDILYYGFLFGVIGGAFLISQGNKKSVFGYSFMNVLTWSMGSEIPQGSMVVVKRVDTDTIQIGDDITYMKDEDASVTHRVINIFENFEGSGERGFETQGVENDVPDFKIVPAVNVVGVVKFCIPKLGSWLEWLRKHLILALVFLAGFILLMILMKGALKKTPEERKDATIQ